MDRLAEEAQRSTAVVVAVGSPEGAEECPVARAFLLVVVVGHSLKTR